MTKYVLIFIAGIISISVLLFLKPVPVVYEKKAITEKGIVSNVYHTENNDIIFQLEGNNRIFYINRGEEKGLSSTVLREKLIGNQIVLKYPKYWTPLDWNNEVKHISKVEFKNKILFNELKK